MKIKSKEKVKDFTKSNIAKPIVYGAIFASSILHSNNIKGQQYEAPEVKSALDMFSQPNLHIQNGKATYEYFGSADVNLDGIAGDELDAQAIDDGVVNDRADVNGIDGVTSADAQMIRDNLVGIVPYLPGRDFNHLNGNLKVDWIKKCLRIDDADTNYGISPDGDNEVCGDYVTRGEIHFRGGGDADGYDDPNVNFDENAIGRFNLPAYYASTTIQTAGGEYGHALLTFFVGDRETPYEGNPTQREGYVTFDIQNRHGDTEVEEIEPGSLRMRNFLQPNFHSKVYGYSGSVLLTINFPENGEEYTSTINYIYEDYLLLENPNNKPPLIEDITDATVNYSVDMNISPAATGTPDVTDITDPNPSLNYSDTDNQTASGIGKYNYDITREWTAKDFDNNSSSLEQTVFIRDLEDPTYDAPVDKTYNYQIGLNIDPNETGVPTNVQDNAEVASTNYSDVSTQVTNGTIDQINYTISRTWNVADITGNVTSKIQNINVADSEKPLVETSSNYIKIDSQENAVNAAKSLVNYTYDNSELPVDTIATNTTGNYYDVQTRDIAGNLSDAVEVQVDVSTGIDNIEISNKPCDIKMLYPSPISGNATILYTTTYPGKIRFIIINTSGNTVESFKEYASYGENHFQHNFSNLSTGMYFIKVESCEDKVVKFEIRE